MVMSCKRRFLGCLNDVDFRNVNEFLSPPESESSNIPFQSNLTPEEFNDFLKDKYSNEELRKKSILYSCKY